MNIAQIKARLHHALNRGDDSLRSVVDELKRLCDILEDMENRIEHLEVKAEQE